MHGETRLRISERKVNHAQYTHAPSSKVAILNTLLDMQQLAVFGSYTSMCDLQMRVNTKKSHARSIVYIYDGQHKALAHKRT